MVIPNIAIFAVISLFIFGFKKNKITKKEHVLKPAFFYLL